MKHAYLVPFALAAAYAQTSSGVRHEGSFWTQTVNGTVSVPAQGRLQVESIGSVTVRGHAGTGEITYTLRKRTQAGSEAEARKLLDAVTVRPRVQNGVVQFVVSAPRNRQVMADLEVTAPKTLQTVRLRTGGGGLEAYDIDGEVDAETAGGIIRMDRIGRRVAARSGGGELTIGTVTGPVTAISGGGSIRIDRTGGETTVESAGGNVSLREVWGPLRVATGGGNIRVEQASSSVAATTAGGMIEVGKAGGGVKCQSYAGAIRLKNVNGGVNASTANGSILAELMGNHIMNSVLRTALGDVTVFIPSNVAVTVRAQNESGSRAARIVSDFPEIRVQPASMTMAVAEGALNGGGPVLSVSTSNGTIYLRRQK